MRIRIDDLRRPDLTAAQRDAIAAAERAPLDMTPGAVLQAAVDLTGLDDFGPDDFVERMGLWLDEAAGDPQRNALGRAGIVAICTRYAANRLRIHELLRLHPEIRDIEIAAPIVVAGLPRSGTTHLVNLIAADSRLRSLPLWESYEPVPNPAEAAQIAAGRDPRVTRAQQSWDAMLASLPYMAAMHPMHPEHIHEELELQVPDFSSYSLEWHMRCPGWRDYYLSHDQTPHYAYMKTVLQILQWYRPRERWVLKCPQHLEQLGPLLTTFPDATVVMTHRDPVSVVQSAATMLCYISRLSYASTDPDHYLGYWTERVRLLLDASMRDRHLVPSDRCVDVRFHEFMADDLGTVERIYDTARLPMSDVARAEITKYRDAHPRGRDGQVVYDLRADFDAEPADVRAGFDEYCNRFAIDIEVT